MAKIKKVVTIILRILGFVASVIAISFMVTSHDSTEVLNLTFTAKYSNTPAFKYFVIAESIASFYSVVAVFLSSKSMFWRLIILLDMVMTLLLASCISAALAIAEVGKKGNSHAGWLAVCNQVPKFCNHATVALASGFMATIFYFFLLSYSLYVVLSPIFAIKT